MPKNKYLTNRELLAELEKRLPDFTGDEFVTLLKVIQPHQQKVLKIIQNLNPQIHSWIQEKNQQIEQEKTDKEIDQLKKSLGKNNQK